MTTTAGTRPRLVAAAEWAGVLTGPAAWTIHLWFNYGLEEFLACQPGALGSAGGPAFLGIEDRWWIIGSNVVLAALTLAAGLMSLARYRRLRSYDPTPGRRAEWMALSGVMLSALFFIVIVLGVAPAVILQPCTRSP